VPPNGFARPAPMAGCASALRAPSGWPLSGTSALSILRVYVADRSDVHIEDVITFRERLEPGRTRCIGQPNLQHLGGRRRSGRRITNSLPLPGPALYAHSVPRCSSTRCRATASPRPRPLRVPSGSRRERTYTLKIFGNRSAAIPIPVSRTHSFTHGVSCSSITWMAPRLGVNLAALISRFDSTCVSLP
jgi:hypothetical protein